MTHEVLHVRGLRRAFADGDGTSRVVLDGIDLTLQAGERLAIRGPSGAGKTTLLHCCVGLEEIDAGAVQCCGLDLATADRVAACHMRAHHCGLIFQDHHLLSEATVLENVLMPLLARGPVATADAERAGELLARVGLGDRAAAWPRQLSGGERQRVAVARALVNRPRLLIADEPTGALDAENAQAVAGLLRELVEEAGAALLLVTHDEAVATGLPARTLRGGRLENS